MSIGSAILPNALLDRRVWPHPVKRRVRLIETQISWVFLTGKYVYKVKKPVNLGFLDFTTFAKRKHAIETELRVNRLFSPSLYIGIVTIVETPMGVRLGRRGRVIEYALKMYELPQEAILLHRLEQRKLTTREVESLARTIAKAHLRLPRKRWMRRYASPRFQRENLKIPYSLLRKDAYPRFISKPALSRLIIFARALLKKTQPFFIMRQSLSRRLHGDCNAKNIFVLRGRAYFFDAMEFKKEWQYGDPARDIAGILMDLEAYGKFREAEHFLKTYLALIQDHGIGRVLPYYKTMWAIVHFWFWASLFKQQRRLLFRKRAERYKRLCFQYLTH